MDWTKWWALPKEFLENLPYIAAMVTDLVRDAEEIFKEAGMGKIKKEYVLNAMGILLNTLAFFKKATKDYQNLYLNLISMWIDVLVASFNAYGKWGRKVVLDFPSGSEV